MKPLWGTTATGVLLVAVIGGHVASPTVRGQTLPTPLTLDTALDYALQHYPTIRAAIEQANAATAGVAEARAGYLPRLDAVWQTNRATANNVFGQLLPQSVIPAMSGPVLSSATAGSVWGTAAGALVSWDAIDFGLRAAAVREAQAGRTQAEAQEAVARLVVQSAVGAAYLTLVSAEQAVAATDADVQRRDVLARAAHVLADNQLRPGAEASRADAERAAAQTRAIRARQGVAIARAELTRVLGVQGGPVSVNATSLLENSPRDTSAAGPSATHPLIQVSEAALGQARAREDVLTRTDRPRVLLQSAVFARGTGAYPDGHLGTGADGLWFDRANWAAGIQVVFPNVFDLANLHARQAAAAASTRAEDARREEAVLEITARQQTADAVVDAAVAVAGNTPVQLAAARQTEAQARARYDAGLASITEVAEAQELLAAAEYQDALARVDVWLALLGQGIARGDLAQFLARVRGAGVP